jgi:flagellar biosynthesis GTPase FlhF
MANLLRTGLVEFTDTLNCCGKQTIFTTDNRNIDKVLIETQRPYGIPDIICVMKDGIEIIVEILHTHKTSASNRIGTWFEVRASDVIEGHENPKFNCIRYGRCDECEAKRQKEHLEWLARREAERIEECKRKEAERKYREEYEKRKAIEEAEAEERRRKNLEREREEMRQMETERFKQYAERMRLAEIERHKEALIRDQIRREEMLKYEEEKRLALIRIEEEKERTRQYIKHYNSIHEEFIREVVDKYVYDPNARPETESVIYKDCDFLHPHHIIRFRHLKNKSKPLTNET